MTNAQKEIKLEKVYWSKVLEDSTKDDILTLAKKMDLRTHHASGRQMDLKQIKAGIAYNKIADFRDALRNSNNN
jgi:hypothetical protein